MASQVLYLKWRPQRFDEVVGQEHITRTLQNALRSGRIAHAYLFTGPRGTGKTTMARLLAKAVNCLDEDVNNRPCNRCTICQSVNEGRLLDLIEMDAASNTGVDNVREAIREKVGFRPNEARYKVYVIDEVHMLSTSAFNALLKTLEEPPEHVIFCLATTEPHKILPTIISRCQRFDFRRIPASALVARLQHIASQEGLQVEEEALRFIVHLSTGCARDAISLLDQLTAYGDQEISVERIRSVLGLGDMQMVHDLVAHLAAHEIGRGLGVIYQAVESGVDIRQFTQQVLEYLRSLLLIRVGGGGGQGLYDGLGSPALELDAQTMADMASLAGQLSTGDLVRAIKLLNQAQLDLRGSDQSQLALELAFVEAALGEELAAGEPERAGAHVRGGAALPPALKPEARSVPSPAAVLTADASDVPDASMRDARRTLPPAPVHLAPAPAEAASRAGEAVQAEAPGPSRPDRPEAAAAPLASEAGIRAEGIRAEGIRMEEIALNWTEIRHAIKSESWQAEALVNSAFIRRIEDGVRVVFEFPSKLLAGKLEKVETKRVVERAIQATLGKPCRVQGVVTGQSSSSEGMRESTFPAQEASTEILRFPFDTLRASAQEGEGSAGREEPVSGHVPNVQHQVLTDPIVQELQSLGGKVTRVEKLQGRR